MSLSKSRGKKKDIKKREEEEEEEMVLCLFDDHVLVTFVFIYNYIYVWARALIINTYRMQCSSYYNTQIPRAFERKL